MRRDEFLKQVDLYSKYLNTVLQKSNKGEMDFNIAYNQLNALTLVRYGLLTNPKISISLGNPEEEKITQYKYIPTNFFTNGLYENQKEAVIKALNMENILAIQGPPGTGKTTVISEIIQQLKHRDPKARFLVTSASHLAVDNVISSLSESKMNNISMVRIKGTTQSGFIKKFEIESFINEHIKNYSKNYTQKLILEYFKNNLHREIGEISKQFDLVAITLNAIVGSHFDMKSPFDYVIIDEVAKSSLPEICSALIYGKKVIFIGDHKQLPPIINEEAEGNTPEIEYLSNHSYCEYLFENIHPSSKSFLNKQFRMSNNIGDFISDEFYNNPRLFNGLDKPNKDGLNYVDYDARVNVCESNTINTEEIEIVCELIKKFDEKKTIGVISFYKVQAEALSKKIKKKNVLIGTVDSFQGQGLDIIICCINRNGGGNFFISNPNRINVAISRAKEQFWLISNKKYLSKIKIFDHFYNYKKGNIFLTNAYKFLGKQIKPLFKVNKK